MKTYLTKYLQRENVQIYGITLYLYVHYKYYYGHEHNNNIIKKHAVNVTSNTGTFNRLVFEIELGN